MYHIRLATPDDAEALLRIYSYYVENTCISYELESPTVEEFRHRIEEVLKHYPYLVAELDSQQPKANSQHLSFYHHLHIRSAPHIPVRTYS